MCGIVAVLPRTPRRPPPPLGPLVSAIDGLAVGLGVDTSPAAMGAAADSCAAIDLQLRGVPGCSAMLDDGVAGLVEATDRLGARLDDIERRLDSGSMIFARPEDLEACNAVLVRLRDAWWAISRDRVDTARSVAGLVDGALDRAALGGLWAIHVALASIDRLEVRGRDSAGIHVLVADHGLDVDAPDVQALVEGRDRDPLFPTLGVRSRPGCLSFVYKTAAEIGELGDNVAALRTAVRSDTLLARALAGPGARVTVVGHTRWASVGVISQPNAHPLNSDELGRVDGPYVVAALNGDVDNHGELRLSEGLALAPEVTTDAKIIPAMVSRRIATGDGVDAAFAATVARFDGSVAIAASSADAPDRLHLALRGSGQSLNVGLADDAFVVASEAYGLVEETSSYVRLDGEVTRGVVVVLDRDGAGTLEGMRATSYAGMPVPLGAADVGTASITTRDIDRAGSPHFLLKEIGEAPVSFRKTLRGRVVAGEGELLTARLGPDSLPDAVVEGLRTGRLRRILVIGQGTAAVAGRAVGAALASTLGDVVVESLPATELSGFGLVDDMTDTVVVAISQSGTTTDTNRTVDLARGRGAAILAVVNRRNSDLAAKAHGVLYTSDGRDVEMSVASTKAFYAQVAAGWVLAVALGVATGRLDADGADRRLRALRDVPDAMERVLALRPEIARIASAVAPPRRYWAIVGSGPDRVAAAEVRIKCSELCYKAIACDAIEDKKHIDLSTEPLILVCAGGLSGPNADDAAKEVAIYRAHKAAPVVIAAAGEGARFAGALEVVEVPRCDPELAFVLSAMVGHLFGYEAAMAIDAQARPLREARAMVEAVVGASVGPGVLEALAPQLRTAAAPFLAGLRSGSYDGTLEASTAVHLVSLLRYATAELPIEGYEIESGKIGAPAALLGDLFDALSMGIDELTRPVDAIKHQAKTVTVGISRSEDALLTLRLVEETMAAGATPDSLGYRALRSLAALDAAVDEVLGHTRYRIDGGTITVVDQGGSLAGVRSRTSSDQRLRGTKHRAADEREVTVTVGRSDGRQVVLVPELKASQVVGMTLLHVRLADHLPATEAAAVLRGYRGRLSALSDAVTETESTFDESVLATVPLAELLTEPVYVLADRWRRG